MCGRSKIYPRIQIDQNQAAIWSLVQYYNILLQATSFCPLLQKVEIMLLNPDSSLTLFFFLFPPFFRRVITTITQTSWASRRAMSFCGGSCWGATQSLSLENSPLLLFSWQFNNGGPTRSGLFTGKRNKIPLHSMQRCLSLDRCSTFSSERDDCALNSRKLWRRRIRLMKG